MRPSRTPTRLASIVAVVALGLVGCGGGGGGAERDPSPAPGGSGVGTTSTTAAGSGSTGSFRTLANAVCRAEVADVPRVPDVSKPDADPARLRSENRRYVAAIERAAGGLADAFVLLERRRPEAQGALGPLVTKARAVERAARSATAGDGGAPAAGGVQDEVRVAIALLNEASSAAGLPTCAL